MQYNQIHIFQYFFKLFKYTEMRFRYENSTHSDEFTANSKQRSCYLAVVS